MSAIEARLLNDFQRGFPLVAAPWRTMAQQLDLSEKAVMETLARLAAEGKVSRVGGIFAPGRVGASTLAALAASPQQLAQVAARVSAHPGVNHNYEREHRLNLWFVATAANTAGLESLLASIESDTGCEVFSLPLEEEYHIDLGFDLHGRPKPQGRITGALAACREPLSDQAARLVAALEGGLDLVPRPFSRLGMKAGVDEDTVLETLRGWLQEGVLRRFGVIVRHHELGYTANAMSVWNIPDAAVTELGRQLASEPDVTLCYRRRRAEPAWPYNLYCMIHGTERVAVERRLARINADFALGGYDHAVLFSLRRFKQCGSRYHARPERSHG